jgi:hypothetical protein
MFAYRIILREQARPAVIRESGAGPSQSYQAGNTGYSGAEQARPAFGVLAAVAAVALIAAATRAQARCQPIGRGEADPSGAFH